ncbi:MAG: HesA/MoeB/ThiF family protein [Desulfamplus sp.]|nr:HesA/MoeB/ThiF family protein [Desulfamplus sp.]
MERYSRNFNTLSLEEQKRLWASRVCIVGLGGLGGAVTEMLARIGVGHLTLVDGDKFDITNLNRQLLATEVTINESKAETASKRVRAINSNVLINCCGKAMTRENSSDILDGIHAAVDCLDNIEDRFMLQEAGAQAGIPVISGAIAGTSGQVTVIYPGDRGFESLYGKREQGDVGKGVEEHLGNLSFCAFFVASVQASETVKVLLNRGDILRNRLFIADLMNNVFDVMTLQ